MEKRYETHRNNVILVCFSLLLIAITLPRFNRNDIGFLKKITGGDGLSFVSDRGIEYKNLSSDAQQYLLLVSFFRYNTSDIKSKLQAPYCYRPLEPLVASILPFDEATSLNIINVISLLLGLYFLEIILRQFGVFGKAKNEALLLYIISFPVFYYGTISYLDPFFLFLMIFGLYLLQKEKWFVFPLYFFIGTFGKEGIAILLPVAFIMATTDSRNKTLALVSSLLATIAYTGSTLICRHIFPIHEQYLWTPSIGSGLMNVTRLRAYVSILISFGIPGILSTIFIVKTILHKNYSQYILFWPLVGGFVASIGFCFFGLITVHSDGRYIWPIYTFAIPLSALYLRSLKAKNTFA